MDIEKAVQFIKTHGNDVERARLDYILSNVPPSVDGVLQAERDEGRKQG